MQFDPRYQESANGPLTKAVRGRIQKLREKGFTLKDIGDRLDFSGAFVSQMLNDRSPARVRSIHIPGMIQALEHAEVENGIVPSVGGNNYNKGTNATFRMTPAKEAMSLEELIEAIEAKGFLVSLKRKEAA